MSIKARIDRDYQDALKGVTYMFAGLNNVLDPYNLPIDKGWLPKADNVDIDNTNSISRRGGYTSVISTTTAHSGWSNGTKAYYVDNSYLKEFNGTSATIVDIVSQSLPMYYCVCNDVIAYSNGVEYGYIGGTNSQISTYSPTFKEESQLGTLLEFYNGRLYHVKENSLFCTDVFDLEHSDVRHKHVLTVKSAITMVKRVEDGLYVGSELETHFLKGDDIVEGGFTLEIVCDYGVILGTAVSSVGEYFPESKSSGPIAIWTSKRGICTGGSGGNFKNHSLGIVSIPETKQGCALIRDIDGYRQYLTTIGTNTTEYNPYPTPTFDVNTI